MLIATIKDFGTHLCPWCLVSIDQIHAIGQEDDQRRCEGSCRRDDIEQRNKVDSACKKLYDEGYVITGDNIDGLLKDESLVLTKVFVLAFTVFTSFNTTCAECILSGTFSIWL